MGPPMRFFESILPDEPRYGWPIFGLVLVQADRKLQAGRQWVGLFVEFVAGQRACLLRFAACHELLGRGLTVPSPLSFSSSLIAMGAIFALEDDLDAVFAGVPVRE